MEKSRIKGQQINIIENEINNGYYKDKITVDANYTLDKLYYNYNQNMRTKTQDISIITRNSKKLTPKHEVIIIHKIKQGSTITKKLIRKN